MFNKAKKPNRFYKSFSGEYMGNEFEIMRRKMDKATYNSLKKKLGKRPHSKIEYVYRDEDVSRRYLTKEHFDNLIENSEVLYDEVKEKYVRY